MQNNTPGLLKVKQTKYLKCTHTILDKLDLHVLYVQMYNKCTCINFNILLTLNLPISYLFWSKYKYMYDFVYARHCLRHYIE